MSSQMGKCVPKFFDFGTHDSRTIRLSWIAGEKVLMIVFGRIEFFKRHDLRHDRSFKDSLFV